MRPLLLSLLLLSCSCAWLLYPHKAPVSKPRQDEALKIVRDTYRPLLGAKVDTATMHVRWSDKLCPYPDASGVKRTAVIHNGKCFAGLTFMGGEVLVAWRGSFSKSAFAHELMHTFLNASGHGNWLIDPVAPGTTRPGNLTPCAECVALVDAANATLAGAGL